MLTTRRVSAAAKCKRSVKRMALKNRAPKCLERMRMHPPPVYRRAPGDAIDPCVATMEDLMRMTIPQLNRFAKKYHIALPEMNPLTGGKPLKADIVAAIHQHTGAPCTRPQIDMETASIHDLGLQLKYLHQPLPPARAPALTGACPRKASSRGKPLGGGARPCRQEYLALVQSLSAAPQAAVMANKPAPVIQPVTPAAAAQTATPAVAKMTVKDQPTAGIKAKDEAPLDWYQTVGAPFEELPVEIAQGTVKNVVNPISGAKSIEFGFDDPANRKVALGAAADVNALNATYYPSRDYDHTYVIDAACEVDVEGRPELSEVGQPHIFYSCKTDGDKRVCGRGILAANQLDGYDTRESNGWKKAVQQYMAYDKYTQDSLIVLPFKRAWTCEGKSEYTYRYGNAVTGKDLTKAKGVIGFVAADIPDGYDLVSLRVYMERVMKAKNARGVDYGIIVELLNKIRQARYGPEKLHAREVGILIPTNGPLEASKAIIYPLFFLTPIEGGTKTFSAIKWEFDEMVNDVATKKKYY